MTKDILQRSMMCGTSLFNKFEITKSCAIALAVRDIFPKAEVMLDSLYPTENVSCCISLPPEATYFIYTFDKLKDSPKTRITMPEISFEIDVPDAIIEKIGIDEAKEILKKSDTLELVE